MNSNISQYPIGQTLLLIIFWFSGVLFFTKPTKVNTEKPIKDSDAVSHETTPEQVTPEKKAVQALLGSKQWFDEVLIVKTSTDINPSLTSEMISIDGQFQRQTPEELVQSVSNYIVAIRDGKIPPDTHFFFYKKKDGGLEVKVSTQSAEKTD